MSDNRLKSEHDIEVREGDSFEDEVHFMPPEDDELVSITIITLPISISKIHFFN